jgi:hypothetical protein
VSWSSTVGDYLAELRRLGPERFVQSYPHPVLVHRFGAAPVGNEAAPRFRTDLLSRPGRRVVLEGGPGDLEVSVHGVNKRPGNPYEDTVMLGRASTNDIIVPYTDLSKLHAYFSRGPDGRWQLADAGSTNGTWLGEERLAPNAPVGLDERSEVAFGESSFEFLTARAFAGWLGGR